MFSERMKRLTPYTPGEQPRDRRYVKLNTNENPYPPTPRIRKFLDEFDIAKLRLYPDPSSLELKNALAQAKGLPRENVFLSNSSDEVLSFAFYAFFDAKRGNLLFPEFTYTFYPVYSDYYSIPYKRIPLGKNYAVDLEAFLTQPACGAILPNPNAPTGIALTTKTIRSFLDRFSRERVVIVDEAYVDFGAESVISLIPKYPNLLVIQTFSKGHSLAGMRLGYALGQPHLLKALSTVKNSFNSYPVDVLGQHIGILAVEDREYYAGVSQKIQATRADFVRTLDRLGWETLPSQANFVFTRKGGLTGEEIYHFLKKRGFLVRHFDLEGIRDFVRITIGTDEDMAFLGKVLADLPMVRKK